MILVDTKDRGIGNKMLSILSIGKIIIGSFYGRMVGVALIAWAALLTNNAWQRAKGANIERTKIVKKTNQKAKERNAKASKIRRANPIPGAAKRLRDKYGAGTR